LLPSARLVTSKGVLRVAHRGYVIQTGRIVLHDAAGELLRSDLVRKTHLGEKTR
jgi:branched-chain amino acid transport system ATP-binding protein